MTKQLYDVTLSQSPPSSCHLTATGVPNPSSTTFSAHANKTRMETHGGGNGAALSRDSRQRAPCRRLFVAAKSSLPRAPFLAAAVLCSPPRRRTVLQLPGRAAPPPVVWCPAAPSSAPLRGGGGCAGREETRPNCGSSLAPCYIQVRGSYPLQWRCPRLQ